MTAKLRDDSHYPGVVLAMAFFFLVALFACVIGSHIRCSNGLPLEPARIIQTSANIPDVDISYVNNSGICETTPGVQQMSGYISVGKNMNMVCSKLLSSKYAAQVS